MDPVLHVSAVIVAGGAGKRMRSSTPKQLLDLLGSPVVVWAVKAFDESPVIHSVVVVLPEGDTEVERAIARHGFRKIHAIVAGGPERQDSVLEGLRSVPQSCTHVAVHDGVRPVTSGDIIQRTVDAALRYGNAICAIPVRDTVKTVCEGRVVATPDRETLWQAQTPQVFTRQTLVSAHELARERGWKASDDAALVERLGQTVAVVAGSDQNIKVTTPIDLLLAAEILSCRMRCKGGQP
ncbi:MAG: 2-C-methyl-D-erythritol 4-phosphate cytidylyltransferase [Bacillota bacterium]|nr:2-C-methyl-D-erythritol 4-phosphate cytidylyltransferase [Bacillota bacterium]